MTKELRDKGFVPGTATGTNIIKHHRLSVCKTMHELNDGCATPVTLRGKTAPEWTDIAGNTNKLLAAIGRKPPAQVYRNFLRPPSFVLA